MLQFPKYVHSVRHQDILPSIRRIRIELQCSAIQKYNGPSCFLNVARRCGRFQLQLPSNYGSRIFQIKSSFTEPVPALPANRDDESKRRRAKTRSIVPASRVRADLSGSRFTQPILQFLHYATAFAEFKLSINDERYKNLLCSATSSDVRRSSSRCCQRTFGSFSSSAFLLAMVCAWT